jgi:dipeptidyl aminopeptidase/acylaminoacyl peptidase
MVDALRQRGQEAELHLIPGEGHGFRDSAVRTAVIEATEAFFRRQFHL